MSEAEALLGRARGRVRGVGERNERPVREVAVLRVGSLRVDNQRLLIPIVSMFSTLAIVLLNWRGMQVKEIKYVQWPSVSSSSTCNGDGGSLPLPL